ncbi:MAG: ATP-binding protein [Telluria sp.]
MTGFLPSSIYPILAIAVRSELDVIASRQRARQIAEICGFCSQDQARIGTAVSDLARDVYEVTTAGQVRFSLSNSGASQALTIVVEDIGDDHVDLHQLMGGHSPQASNGMHAARRFMDQCESETSDGGTNIVLTKFIPQRDSRLTLNQVTTAVDRLSSLPSNVALSDANHQNKELGQALSALQEKQEELLELSRQLGEKNDEVEILNARLKEKAASLVSADRRKDEFLAMLSHELRGPLSATAMAVEIMRRPPFSAEQTDRMSQLIGRQAKHMSKLVEDLLDVSRISRGLVSITKSPVDMRDAVAAAVEQATPVAVGKGQKVEVSNPDAACLVFGDRTRLIQVVSNIVGNALRYTPDGGRIAIALECRSATVLLKVSDNGIGIAPELISSLFDLYVQAATDTHSKGGLGLGLALVKSLVEIHDGTVTASSEGLGMGSTFEVALPLVDSDKLAAFNAGSGASVACA